MSALSSAEVGSGGYGCGGGGGWDVERKTSECRVVLQEAVGEEPRGREEDEWEFIMGAKDVDASPCAQMDEGMGVRWRFCESEADPGEDVEEYDCVRRVELLRT